MSGPSGLRVPEGVLIGVFDQPTGHARAVVVDGRARPRWQRGEPGSTLPHQISADTLPGQLPLDAAAAGSADLAESGGIAHQRGDPGRPLAESVLHDHTGMVGR